MLANQVKTKVKIHAATMFGLISALSVSNVAWTQTVAEFFPEQAKVLASDGAASDDFGYSVALDGDRIVVGAHFDDTATGGTNAGSVYVFDRSSAGVWVQTGPIVASDGAANDYFGQSVALDGDRMVVGAYNDDTAGGANAGSVYVFDRSSAGSWVQTGPIVASDGLGGDSFGEHVALDGDRMVVGAPNDDPAGVADAGSVYVMGCASVRNLTTTSYTSSNLAAEIARASTGSTLALRASALEWAPSILDASNKRLTYVGVEPLTIPSSVMMSVATGTIFADGPELINGGLTVQGKLIGPSTGTVAFQQLTTASGGQVSQNGAYFLVNESFATSSGGVCYLDGQVLADSVTTAVGGQNRVSADTDIFGHYTNAGATIIQRGILYIYGSLTNTGTLTGDYNNGYVPPQPGDGYAIGGDYIVGAQASLILPNSAWWLRVGGNVDIAINDSARFEMSLATLEMTGLSTKTAQSLEVLSADLGASESGFSANNFPLGALRVRAGSITTLVNARDNAPGAGSEVMYVDTLSVPVGATLITGGKTIYVHSKSIQGTVSNLSDIVIVDACAGDVDGDGAVGSADLTHTLAAWGTNGQGFFNADINHDGLVDGADLGVLIGAWGPCAN